MVRPHVTTPHATPLGTVSFSHMPTLGETLPLGDNPTSLVEEAPPYDELIEHHNKQCLVVQSKCKHACQLNKDNGEKLPMLQFQELYCSTQMYRHLVSRLN